MISSSCLRRSDFFPRRPREKPRGGFPHRILLPGTGDGISASLPEGGGFAALRRRRRERNDKQFYRKSFYERHSLRRSAPAPPEREPELERNGPFLPSSPIRGSKGRSNRTHASIRGPYGNRGCAAREICDAEGFLRRFFFSVFLCAAQKERRPPEAIRRERNAFPARRASQQRSLRNGEAGAETDGDRGQTPVPVPYVW